MNRMTENKAEQMLAFFADKINLDNLPLDDQPTYDLFQRADTDGIFMMGSDWDKDMTSFRLSRKTSMSWQLPLP